MPNLSAAGRLALEKGITTCVVQPGPGRACYEPAHVVLFAPADMKFAGRTYTAGDRVLACLEHGGQIYDAIHRKLSNVPKWLFPAIDTNSLPASHSPYQTTTPAPSKGWSSRPPKYPSARR